MPFRDEIDFVPPARDALLWRYMNLSKFVDLLATKTLYLPRADKLGDPFEGTLPHRMSAENFAQQVRKHGLPPEVVRGLAENRRELTRRFRRWAYISCWHAASAESEALWYRYAGLDGGIAIVSTLGRLEAALGDHAADCFVSRVQYVNYKTALWKSNAPLQRFIHKRPNFEHEHEVRLLLVDWDQVGSIGTDETGKRLPVSLEELVREVRISPFVSDVSRDAVHHLVQCFGVVFPVSDSEMADDPVF